VRVPMNDSGQENRMGVHRPVDVSRTSRE
jgi:hypothetical protein